MSTDTNQDLPVIVVRREHLPRRMTWYRQHVIEAGHRPGVLSGAELAGKAKRYGGSYARSRVVIERALAPLGVRSDLCRVQCWGVTRWARVWVDSEGRRVRLEIDEKA